MTATGSETYETVYDYTVNGKYTALLQEETKTATDDSNAVTANGLASSPLDLVNLASEDSGVETTAYTYDANGNQITKVTDEKTETNTYDGLNQLIGFTDGETVASYTYDVDGLRLSKTVDGETTEHVWDGNKQIIADVVNSQYYEANCYLRGTNLVATYNYQNGAKSGYTYYSQNAHGDVVNLTDADGAITKSYTYDAFGVEKNIDDADTNAFRYCGEYYDTETGTVYLRARYYNPSTGGFISRDNFAGKSSDPLSLNRYTYCSNNPVFYVNPCGNYGVVIYGTYPNESGSTEDNKSQAEIIQAEFIEKYGECEVYPINTAQEFVDTWNALDDSNGIDEIEYIGHGSVSRSGSDYGIGYLYFGDDSRLYSTSYFTDNNGGQSFDRSRRACGYYAKKSVGKIYFSACNTANLDFNSNIVNAFSKLYPSTRVTGWDGSVY